MDIKQLEPIEQKLVTKLLDFCFDTGNTFIRLKDACSQIELVVSDEEVFDRDCFDINQLENLNKTLEIEANRIRALMSQYTESHEEYRKLSEKLNEINGIIRSIESAIANGGIVKTARLGAFVGNYQKKVLGRVINQGSYIFLFRNNIIEAANNDGTNKETVLPKFLKKLEKAESIFRSDC